ncbi:MAG: bifunctional glutamate N-acetyltransferase/amino-acid acetyltransferase ArgJ [Desulfobacterales bacterium]|nr:bifunctional glutamate N-acetyltransferase/amino-acid acetyltransferase ArgJ [Desulfobacterales bacterium]
MEKILCPGFQAAGVEANIKKQGIRDLGLIFSEVPAKVGGVFTRNLVQAAPVVLDRELIQSGQARAIVVNSGNANCCTGAQGMEDAKTMGQVVADELGISSDQVLVASTGVIGAPMPIDKVTAAIPKLVKSLNPDGFPDLALAMMTTDTMPKLVSKQGKINSKTFTVTAVAKGAGMIRPDMATMLCFVCTDIDADPDYLSYALYMACERSFNRITVDGDTSTNDTALILANGYSGVTIENSVHKASFQRVLDDILLYLAKLMAKDGEGATKLVEINVTGALSNEDAHAIAGTIGNSNLVKTALFGEDANWGRIIAAAGRAGVYMEPHRVNVFFNDVRMCKNGMGCGPEAEKQATIVMKKPEYAIHVDLQIGNGKATMYTCDFSYDYVKINADYRS